MKSFKFKRVIGKDNKETNDNKYYIVNAYGEAIDLRSVVMKQFDGHMSLEQLSWYFDIKYDVIRDALTVQLKNINRSLYEISQKIINDNRHRYRTKYAEQVYQGPSSSCKNGVFFSRRSVVENEKKGIFSKLKNTIKKIVHKFTGMIKKIADLLHECCFDRGKFYWAMLKNIKTYINSPALLESAV